MPTPAAVLWDFDGTLVDTEPYWIRTEFELIEGLGGSWSEAQALQLVGNDLLVSGQMIVAQTGIPLTPAEVVDRLLDGVIAQIRERIPWRPGARELLADLRRRGVPCGLVTMSYRSFVAPVLEALPEGTFACVVTGEEVARGKPDPEPYRRACELLALEPGACIAVEDSVPGAGSAAAAGVPVLVVPAHVPVPDAAGRVVAAELPTDLDGLAAAVSPLLAPAGEGCVGAAG